MYLHEIMEDSDKNEHRMVGIIKGKCRKQTVCNASDIWK